MSFEIRAIQESDNPFLSKIIKTTLKEFGANYPGTVYYDASTHALYEVFKNEKSYYFVALENNMIMGGGGIYPTSGLPADTCELVKMYLSPDVRGKGLGKKLIQLCIDKAIELGYKNIYLETMPELKQALSIYAHFGFEYLSAPLGNSGHTGCSLWMIRSLG